MPRRPGLLVPVVVVVAMLGAACGDDAIGDTSTQASDRAGEGDAIGPWISVAATGLGEVLVTADGSTLYGFTADVDGVSTCSGECAEVWPPLPYDDGTVSEELDGSLLGSTERDDGLVQAVYSGHPLYTFSGDSRPGDTAGQGINDAWYVVDPAGGMVGLSSGESPPDDPFGY